MTSLTLEDELNDSGYAVEVITSCAAALTWLDAFTPDAAILDVSLKNETCREGADLLAARHSPFVIYSGRRQHEGLLPDYPGIEWVTNPARTRRCSLLSIGPWPVRSRPRHIGRLEGHM
ncbi:MAG TPA: hypothetical protein VIL09_10615 [Microvirga sp.]